MMLLVLLLASSGVVLASPRVKGSLLAQSGPSHPTYPNYGIAPRQLPGAYSEYKPIVHIEEHSANSDPNSVLVRINPQDLRYFQVQQSGSPSHSPSSVHRQTPDATFNVPSSQFNAKVNQGSFSSPSVQPVLVKERSSHPHVTQYNTASQDTGRKKRLEQALINSSVKQLLRSTPGEARLINTVPALPALKDRLIDNYTLIIENPVDTFRCGDKNYGYYADVDNNCQIFHVCVPFKQLYPANFTQDITFQFSFICNKHTIFSQDSMTCAWEEEALPCEFAPELYWMNKNFFRKVITPDGERYAHVNEPLP